MVSPNHWVGNSLYGLQFGELRSSILPGGERGHEAENASQGRNLPPAPLAGNEVSDCRRERVLFVQSRLVYDEWKRGNPEVMVGVLLESLWFLKIIHVLCSRHKIFGKDPKRKT